MPLVSNSPCDSCLFYMICSYNKYLRKRAGELLGVTGGGLLAGFRLDGSQKWAKQVIVKGTISWFLHLWLPSKPQVVFTLSCFCFKMHLWLRVYVLQPLTETFGNTAEPVSVRELWGCIFVWPNRNEDVLYLQWVVLVSPCVVISAGSWATWYPGHCIGPLWVFSQWPIS